MKGNIRIVVALLGFAGIVGSVATYKITTIIFSRPSHITPITYHFDERLSQASQKSIMSYIAQNRSMRSQALINGLCTRFDHIKKAQLRYTPRAINMHITAHDLSAVINNQSVITTSGMMLDKNQFDTPTLEELKHIDVHDMEITNTHGAYIPHLIHEWITCTSSSFFTEFDISWLDKNNIECTYKKDPQLIIRCTHTQNLALDDIDSCIHAKNQLSNRMLSMSKKIIADIRFDQQIIISKK